MTDFIRDVEDAVELSSGGLINITLADLEKVRERYKGMVSSFPPSTDKEFIRSKRDYARKKMASAAINPILGGSVPATTSADKGQRLRVILRSNPDRMELLRIVQHAGSDLWLTGGFVRNAVWDYLHDYPISTPLDDVDVIYFDSTGKTVSRHNALNRLRASAPNINWSLKNQADMKDPWLPKPPASLDEALRRFPDTPTAVAVRLIRGDIEILAPYGLDDLFSLEVRSTPGFDGATYRARLQKKNWGKPGPGYLSRMLSHRASGRNEETGQESYRR